MQAGDVVTQGPNSPIKLGNALPLEFMPVGSAVHNVELTEGRGGQVHPTASVASRSTSVHRARCPFASYPTLRRAAFPPPVARQSVIPRPPVAGRRSLYECPTHQTEAGVVVL